MNSVLAYIIGVLVFLFGIGVSIGLHEVGHMWPAKKFGGRVARYMIGFGPTVWSKKTAATEYGIKLIPLGGFVAISGMFPPRPETGTTARKDGWLRNWVEQARRQQLDADGSYDQSRAFYRMSVPKRIVVMLGGPVMNLLLGSVLILASLSGIGGYQANATVAQVLPCVFQTYTQNSCTATDSPSPAAAAGMKSGDVVTALNGKPVTMWLPIQQQLEAHPAQSVTLTVKRGAQVLHLKVTPVVKPRPVYDQVTGVAQTKPDGSVLLRPKGLLGVQLGYQRAGYGLDHSFAFMGYTLATTFSMIADLPAQVGHLAVTTFTGGKRSTTGPVSVLGIGNISGSIADNNNLDLAGKIATWLMILGSLNYALFVFNLVPLLPLDGGHVLSAIIEAVRRGWYRLRRRPDPGPLDTARFVPFTMVMWVLLMGMSVLVILADIVNPISLG